MDLRELETYRLDDAVKFHDHLNPQIWGPDEQMLPAVRQKLLTIADDFRESLGIDVEVKDITISGSNAAYTYTPHSDIDLHLVTDLPQADASEVYRELFDAKKYQYNDEHDLRIGPYDVELYVQDASKPHYSQGIYSIKDDQWISVPKRRKPEVNDISVRSKYEDIGARIDHAIESGDLPRMDALAKKIRDMRQTGLETTGEFGPENLAFKVLRNNGTLQKLKQARLAAKDREMSLQERKKKRRGSRKRWGVFGGYYYPGFGYYGSGSGEATDGGGGDGGGEGREVKESRDMDLDTLLKDFVEFTSTQLGLEAVPRIRIKRDPQWSRANNTFGRYVPEEHTLYLSVANRHPLDVMRTMAHELTHHRQAEVTDMPDEAGDTGSKFENQANAMAGIIMRRWADLHPDMFDQPITENGGDEDTGDFPNQSGGKMPGTPIPFPKGTVKVGVSDVYDWYKLGQHISDLKGLGRHDFGQGPPETVLSFGSEPLEHEYIKDLAKIGLSTKDIDESLRGKLGAAAAAACIAGTPGCATTDITATDALRGVQAVGRAAQATKPYGTASRSDVIRAGAEEELRQELKNLLRRGTGTGDQSRVREADEPLMKLDDPIINYDIPYSAIARPERLHQARRFGLISHYGSPGSSSAIISVPVSKERAFVDTMRNLAIPVKKSAVYEASGYIPTEREKYDPRYKMALTVDVRPGQTGKEANKLGLKTDSQGRPQLLMKRLANLLEETKLDERCWTGYRQQGMKRKGERQVPNCVKVSEGSGLDQQAGIGIDGESFKFKIKDLLSFAEKYPVTKVNPNQFAGQISSREEDPTQSMARVKQADLQYPIIVVKRNNGQLWIADGTHRAHKAVLNKLPAIKARIIPVKDMTPFAVDNLTESAEDLLEVKMSPGELQKWADSPEAEGIQAGFEAELIFRDTSRGESEQESEPDYDQDERAVDIEQVVDFFRGGDYGISASTANRVRDGLYEEYVEWREEAIADAWANDAEDQVRDYMETNVWGDDSLRDEYLDRAQIELGWRDTEVEDLTDQQEEEIKTRALELFDEDVEREINEQGGYWDQAREYHRDMMADGSDYEESDFLSDRYPYMTDVEQAYELDWPYWTEGSSSSGGGRTTEDIADSLSQALGGVEVRAGSGYHGVTRKPGRWIIEPDGSLDPDDWEDAGLEIVSPPMPLPTTLAALRDVIDWANGPGDAYTNGSTGLHMGISIPHKGGDVDYVKLVLFMGDQHVLDQFGRAANSYCASALDKLRQTQTARRQGVREATSGQEKTTAAMDLMRKNLIELAARYVQDGVGTSKYTSAHIKPGYIEFRSPGGDYLSMDSRDEDALKNTMLRFARAMYIAGRPDLERREYSKKLYQLIDSQGDEPLRLFLDYSTGKLNAEELKKQWARQVLAKEPPQATPADQEPAEKPVSRRAQVAKKIAGRPSVWRVTDTNTGRSILVSGETTRDAKYAARNQDGEFQDLFYNDPDSMLVEPATTAEVRQYQQQQKDQQQDSEQVQQRVQQTGSGRYRVTWTERRGEGATMRDSLTVDAANADGAIAAVRHALEAQGRDIVSIQSDLVGSTHDLQQQRADATTQNVTNPGWRDDLRNYLQTAGQTRGEFTGQWQVRNARTGEVLYTFGGIGNVQSDANRIAQQWAQRSRIDDPLEVVPEMR